MPEKIDLQPAHEALTDLLKQLEGLEPVNPKRAGAELEDAQSWELALKTATRGLSDWCSGGGFMIDMKPKP